MRYYLQRFLYKKPGQDDYISLDRIEDLFSGFKPMLGYLVEDLIWKGKLNEAKGVCLRNDLNKVIRENIREQLADVVYNPKLEAPIFDVFGPLSEGNFIRLPDKVQVKFISQT